MPMQSETQFVFNSEQTSRFLIRYMCEVTDTDTDKQTHARKDARTQGQSVALHVC